MTAEETALPNTYLLFKLGPQSLGFEACFLWEVANRTVMTDVPKSTDFLIGISQVHGKIVPVVDLAGLLGLSQPDAVQAGGFIVVNLPGPKPVLAGFYVHEVLGFEKIYPEEIKSRQALSAEDYVPFLSGEWRPSTGEATLLIQMDKLIASQARGKLQKDFPKPVSGLSG
jgi:purine-binding chemotaxis protein CheW